VSLGSKVGGGQGALGGETLPKGEMRGESLRVGGKNVVIREKNKLFGFETTRTEKVSCMPNEIDLMKKKGRRSKKREWRPRERKTPPGQKKPPQKTGGGWGTEVLNSPNKNLTGGGGKEENACLQKRLHNEEEKKTRPSGFN